MSHTVLWAMEFKLCLCFLTDHLARDPHVLIVIYLFIYFVIAQLCIL